jgi:UDP-N-acetylmuramoyl-tripeptide--D-alanyl-D-alanine ligase
MKVLLKMIILKIVTGLAKEILKKHKPFIIGVVGSVGKTTTKDSIAAVLADQNIIHTKKSMNSEFGAPLTIIDAESGWSSMSKWLKVIVKAVKVLIHKDYAKYLVLELGADKKNDIRDLARWIHCDVVVVTKFGDVPVHVENFKDKDELINEDFKIINTMKSSGTIIFNSDCTESIHKMREVMDKEKNINKNVISYGGKTGDYKISFIKNNLKEKCVSAKVSHSKDKMLDLICSGVLGEASLICAMPAVIISDILNLEKSTTFKNIKNMKRENGRMKILDGKKESVLIDDTYNSSPVAVLNGIKTLKDIDVKGRKIAVLGDMMELGEFTKDQHVIVGVEVAKVFDILVTVGSRSKFTAESARVNGMGEGWVLECDDSEEAGLEVLNILKSGDVVYLKGSQSTRMEKAVGFLVSENVNIKDGLVRQNEEWLAI